MKNKIVIIILATLLVISLAFNAIMIYRELTRYSLPDWFNSANELQVGDIAPDFSVQLLTGETFKLSEHRGAIVVLDFWATWCGPCVNKMTSTQTLSEQFGDRVVFVGMNIGENPSQVQDFIIERGFTYHIGLDENASIHENLYPSLGIPYTVIINGSGIIIDIFHGWGDSMHEVMEYAITNALH
jgi:peroxiredoxin